MGDGRLEWFCFFLLAVFHIAGSTAQCVQFTLPDLDSDVVTAAENTNISLKFALQELTPGCLNNSGYFKAEVRKGDTLTLCFIVYSGGQFNPQDPCTNTSEQGVFQFTYTLNRTDDKQKLRWRTSIAVLASDKNITFNITYPADITTFSLEVDVDTNLNVEEIRQGQQLNVNCAWNLGNPSSAGIIYRYRNNENKRELNRTADSATSFTHTIPSAQCDDSGIYSCDVGDDSVNKTLLVQCPPTDLTPLTEFRFENGSSAELRFSVHSYTQNLTSCRLEAVNSSMPSSARKEDCDSSLSVTGSPPDLTVSVRLDSVRREDEGTWKLTLINDVGTGETEFDLTVIELTTTTTTISTTTESTLTTSTATGQDQTNQWVVFIAGGVGLALAVIAVIVVVIIVCRKRKGKAEMITNNLYGGSDDCTMIVNNVYQGSGGTPMTSVSTYEEVGSGRQEPKPSTSKQGVIVGHGGSDSHETAGDDDGRHQNADGLTYVSLDFDDRPATRHAALPAAEETEYADVSPHGPPPRPRR